MEPFVPLESVTEEVSSDEFHQSLQQVLRFLSKPPNRPPSHKRLNRLLLAVQKPGELVQLPEVLYKWRQFGFPQSYWTHRAIFKKSNQLGLVSLTVHLASNLPGYGLRPNQEELLEALQILRENVAKSQGEKQTIWFKRMAELFCTLPVFEVDPAPEQAWQWLLQACDKLEEGSSEAAAWSQLIKNDWNALKGSSSS